MRYTKLARYFLPSYSALERTLVALNYYQNFYVMCLFINTPLLLRLAHEVRAPDKSAPTRAYARSPRFFACVTAPCAAYRLTCPPVFTQILLGSSFPIYGASKLVLGGAILLQVVYDWYWNLRLRKSWVSYQKKLKTLRADKKKA